MRVIEKAEYGIGTIMGALKIIRCRLGLSD